MVTHELKIAPKYFEEVVSGKKKFEIRKNDRDFKKWDKVKLREFKDGEYTGNYIYATIEYVFYGGTFGLEKGYCVFSISVYEYGNDNK